MGCDDWNKILLTYIYCYNAGHIYLGLNNMNKVCLWMTIVEQDLAVLKSIKTLDHASIKRSAL